MKDSYLFSAAEPQRIAPRRPRTQCARLLADKIVYGVLGTLVILAGVVWTIGYWPLSFADVRSPDSPFATSVLGFVFSSVLPLGAFYLGFRYMRKLF
jgi:hypothetical protein